MPDKAGGNKFRHILQTADRVFCQEGARQEMETLMGGLDYRKQTTETNPDRTQGDAPLVKASSPLRDLLAFQLVLEAKKTKRTEREVLADWCRRVRKGGLSILRTAGVEDSGPIEVLAEVEVRSEVLAMRELYLDGRVNEQDALYSLLSRFPSSGPLVSKLWRMPLPELRALVHVTR